MLRYDERREVNETKIHRLRKDAAQVHSPRKRVGLSSIPPVVTHALKVLRPNDFQLESTIVGKAIEIASMFDEHTRVPLPNIVERAIAASGSSSTLGCRTAKIDFMAA